MIIGQSSIATWHNLDALIGWLEEKNCLAKYFKKSK
jgi:hypothetical protein